MTALVLALALAAAPAEPFLRLRAVGDVMLGTSVPEGHLPPEDGATLLDAVKPLLQDADLTFANFEGPLCDTGSTTKCRKGGNCYAFRTPTRYGAYVEAAGIDLGSTANNHSGDFGEVCRRETEATLGKHKVAWSGAPGSIGTTTFKGKKVALVAFHTSAACNDVNDLPGAKKLVAKAKAEADLVIVSFHGGAEGTKATRVKDGMEKYLGERRGDLKAFAHGVVDAGADLVLGHGPHVLRGMELYKERLIAYSLGNFATYGRFDLSGPLGVTVVLEASLAEDGRFVGGKLFPVKQEGRGIPKPDESGKGARMVKELTQQDFPKTGVHIDEAGGWLLTPAPRG
jgi:poly-gamma-glutamate capsule biosynthesis protein CapA/YwtB (metallophosphatase superfamily)